MNSVLAGIFLPAEETHSSAMFAKKQGFERIRGKEYQ